MKIKIDTTATNEQACAITAAIAAYLDAEAMAKAMSRPGVDIDASNYLPKSWSRRNRSHKTTKSWRTRYLDCRFTLLMAGLALAISSSQSAAWAQIQQDTQVIPDSIASAPLSLGVPLQSESGVIRVLLGTANKFVLDCPEGARIYKVSALDGQTSAMGRITEQSTFNVSYGADGRLALAPASINANNPYLARIDIDRANASGIAKASFLPANAIPSDLPPVLTALDNDASYIIYPDKNARSQTSGLLGYNDKLYRGYFLLRPNASSNGKVTGYSVINILPIEDYLLSVVPSEVPSKWHPEVLKAQAIAARSYAWANLGKHGKDGYDVKNTVEDQVYAGVSAECEETNRAVQSTSQTVIKYDKKIISAFFHSTSGGVTELAENVWSKPVPYLKVVPDYDDASPLFTWSKTFAAGDLARLIAPDSDLISVFVVSRYPGDGQRVKDVLLVGSNKFKVISGAEMRKALKLSSTSFSISQCDQGYLIAGRGFGHGLGMSQWGAKALAERGYNAKQILAYYYKDVSIEPAREVESAI